MGKACGFNATGFYHPPAHLDTINQDKTMDKIKEKRQWALTRLFLNTVRLLLKRDRG